MSDQPGKENYDDGLTSHSLDSEDQLQPEDTLMGDQDPLDAGYSPPERLHGSIAWGTTAEEQAQDETIEQRIRQELPDPDTAYGAPEHESDVEPAPEMLGGDDPDAIPAARDFVGVESEAAGRLIAPDGGSGSDTEPQAVAEQAEGTSPDSPEDAAVHIESEPPTT